MHVSANQQKKLLQLLKKYELLFDGTFGHWKTKPVSFQLKEGVSPYPAEHSQYQRYINKPLSKR
jgi:hypothetical protein